MLIWRMPKRNWDLFYHVGVILTIVMVNTKPSSPATSAVLGRGGFVLRDACATSMLPGTSGTNGDGVGCTVTGWQVLLPAETWPGSLDQPVLPS